jgi:hypothetical protein
MNQNPWPSSVFSPERRARLARAAGRPAVPLREILREVIKYK